MSILSKNGISVAQVIQEKDAKDGKVPVVLITHVTHEHNVNKAVADINATGNTAKVASVIRVV